MIWNTNAAANNMYQVFQFLSCLFISFSVQIKSLKINVPPQHFPQAAV